MIWQNDMACITAGISGTWVAVGLVGAPHPWWMAVGFAVLSVLLSIWGTARMPR